MNPPHRPAQVSNPCQNGRISRYDTPYSCSNLPVVTVVRRIPILRTDRKGKGSQGLRRRAGRRRAKVALVARLWSPTGRVTEGRVIALGGAAGHHGDLPRGGGHYALWRRKFDIHTLGPVAVRRGQRAHVSARDGGPLPSSQPPGRVV